MPRIKDIKDQQLYHIDRNTHYGELDTLLTKTINLNLIMEQLDEMVKVVASLKDRITPAQKNYKEID